MQRYHPRVECGDAHGADEHEGAEETGPARAWLLVPSEGECADAGPEAGEGWRAWPPVRGRWMGFASRAVASAYADALAVVEPDARRAPVSRPRAEVLAALELLSAAEFRDAVVRAPVSPPTDGDGDADGDADNRDAHGSSGDSPTLFIRDGEGGRCTVPVPAEGDLVVPGGGIVLRGVPRQRSHAWPPASFLTASDAANPFWAVDATTGAAWRPRARDMFACCDMLIGGEVRGGGTVTTETLLDFLGQPPLFSCPLDC